MKKNLTIILFLTYFSFAFSQTKVGGYVKDEYGDPVAFANVIFSGSTEGVLSDESGKFYLDSDKIYRSLTISFMGYQTLELSLDKSVNFNINCVLKEATDSLGEVVIISGRQPKKNNPAVDILKKIWQRKRINGLRLFDQYKYDSYEKIEFDLNTIDSALVESKLFKGMEFIFDQVDTSRVTGKTYLPVFINEASKTTYGDNISKKTKSILKGNKNSGFSSNQFIIDFIDDLYSDYNIYDNYLKIFDKSFISPLSKTGVDVYNYVLSDSAFIENKWCYNIIYYPRRKSELTFKGDFWVNDTTFAIKDINMQASKSANINWVKDIYIEQEYEVLNDSVFLMKRDYFLSDFSFQKKDQARGLYGKRTTIYDNYKFNEYKDEAFYKQDVFSFDALAYNRDEAFWGKNRLEALNKNEKGVYAMLDTLMTVKKFNRLYNWGTVLASGYYEFLDQNFDYGPIFSTFGYNDVEGLRLRAGGRTYFGPHDLWRLQGFLAYGFGDKQFKYGLSGKWLVDKKKRIILAGGYRKDIEQIGASLTSSTDVLGRSLASNTIFGTAPNDKLTNIHLGILAAEIEPVKNLVFKVNLDYRTLESASKTFSLDYYDEDSPTGISSKIEQFETSLSLFYYLNRKMTGYGVERNNANNDFTTFFAQISRGSDNFLNSKFNYVKLQASVKKPWQIGGFGRLTTSFEAGKLFNDVPLGLLSVVPGNQSYFSVYNSFSQLNFYEFVTDTYTTFHLEHNFNGRLFSRIPFLRKLNWRELVGFRAAWGTISNENIALNASDIVYRAPSDEPYYEYSLGIGNIFKFFRLDFNFRGNYLHLPGSRDFGITGSFGFYF